MISLLLVIISNICQEKGTKTKIDYESSDFDYNLRDFYIKSAYNCCCGGKFKNDYVNICMIHEVMP